MLLKSKDGVIRALSGRIGNFIFRTRNGKISAFYKPKKNRSIAVPISVQLREITDPLNLIIIDESSKSKQQWANQNHIHRTRHTNASTHAQGASYPPMSSIRSYPAGALKRDSRMKNNNPSPNPNSMTSSPTRTEMGGFNAPRLYQNTDFWKLFENFLPNYLQKPHFCGHICSRFQEIVFNCL